MRAQKIKATRVVKDPAGNYVVEEKIFNSCEDFRKYIGVSGNYAISFYFKHKDRHLPNEVNTCYGYILDKIN